MRTRDCSNDHCHLSLLGESWGQTPRLADFRSRAFQNIVFLLLIPLKCLSFFERRVLLGLRLDLDPFDTIARS